MNADLDLVRKKLVVIGNGNVGKTSLLYAFKDNRFCHTYVPTLFEGNTHVIEVDNKRIELLLIDTAGQEEYARSLFVALSPSLILFSSLQTACSRLSEHSSDSDLFRLRFSRQSELCPGEMGSRSEALLPSRADPSHR